MEVLLLYCFIFVVFGDHASYPISLLARKRYGVVILNIPHKVCLQGGVRLMSYYLRRETTAECFFLDFEFNGSWIPKGAYCALVFVCCVLYRTSKLLQVAEMTAL